MNPSRIQSLHANCKLNTLRQYYRLSECGAHTALGDVNTVIDLMQQVLRPLAEKRGLETWATLRDFTDDEWYPSRLPFGKFKGRLYQEADGDSALKSWLEWLAESSNERSSRMGFRFRSTALTLLRNCALCTNTCAPESLT